MVSEVIEVMLSLAGEWEYSGPVEPTTRFFADMELQSLDFVILSTALTRKFGKIPISTTITMPSRNNNIDPRAEKRFLCSTTAAGAGVFTSPLANRF